VSSRYTTPSDYWHFFVGFLRRPRSVGAVAPSSPHLSEVILEDCDLRAARVVVELGAGTGAITSVIRDRIGPHTNFLALEIDEQHVRRLRDRFPDVQVCNESAEYLCDCLARRGLAAADCIICGLPWASMTRSTQSRIMEEILAALKPGGQFCGFGYVHASWHPSARAFRRTLRSHFPRVRISSIVWRNLPPAFAYSCL
jgi:phospholipid N-methyltransferase